MNDICQVNHHFEWKIIYENLLTRPNLYSLHSLTIKYKMEIYVINYLANKI